MEVRFFLCVYIDKIFIMKTIVVVCFRKETEFYLKRFETLKHKQTLNYEKELKGRSRVLCMR
jgi:hypothetical protein